MKSWFKMLWLNSEERQILKDAKGKKEEKTVAPLVTIQKEEIKDERPYTKLLFSNRNLTVIFTDGSIISKSEVDKEIFNKVKACTTQDQVIDIMIGKAPVSVEWKQKDDSKTNVETTTEKELVSDNLDVLKDNEDFIITGEDVFLKGVNLAIPSIVVASFIEILEEREWLECFPEDAKDDWDSRSDENHANYDALKTFWLKLALNPLEQSREDLLLFVKNNDVRITPNGNLILYRRVVAVGQRNKDLTAFISQQYYDRKKQKKAHTHPRNYVIVMNENRDGYLLMNEAVARVGKIDNFGNLEQLYKNLDSLSENTYTSWHNKGETSIKVGSIYSIPDSGIDLNNGVCHSGGLHAAAVNYDYTGYGDTPVVVLVNPSKAITVPRGEMAKLRTTEMFVACVNDKPHGIHFDEDALTSFDEEYHDLTLQELEEAVVNKTFNKLTIKDNKPIVSLVDVNRITNMLKDRIKTVI